MLARVMGDDCDDDELRRALAHLYRNPDAVPESLRAALLSARSAGPPVELEEPGEPDEDDTEIKAADPDEDEDDGPSVAGVVLLAADTGRILMLQRAFDDPDDPARGRWEVPGGHLEESDPDPLEGAKREWSEEIGHPVPANARVMHEWTSPNGVYRGYVLVIPHEAALDLSADRTIVNPDDDHEQVAWWKITDAMANPALRRECQRTPWNALKRTVTAARKAMNVEEKEVPVDVEVKRAGDSDDDGIPDAKDPTPRGSSPGPGKPPAKTGGKKRRVASKEGERRYGLPIGTELGNARDDDGQRAQDDPAAREAYQKLLTANPREYRAMLDKMGDAELESLTRVAYSFRSSNPQVVQARIALAGALRRRGKDVNDFGGLGKGRPLGKANTGPAKGPAKTGGRSTGRAGTGSGADGGRKLEKGEDPTWIPGETWQARRARRAKLGLMGRGVPPSAKRKRGEGGALMTLHVYEDGSWQYKGVAPGADLIETTDGAYVIGEIKRAAAPVPTDPWERALQHVEQKKADKGGTDDPGIKTVGDLAAAIKRARSTKDPAVRAKIRAAAKRIGGPATNMIPKEWSDGGGKDDDGKGKGKGKGGWTPPWEKSLPAELEHADPYALAAYIEAKAMSPDPNAARLREYWAHGAGRKKWRPGTGGDFERLRRHLRKYVPAHMLNGLTANIHKLATGEWPGKNAHSGKSIYGDDVEVKTINPDLLAEAHDLDPYGTDDDAITLALDRYADMSDELTTEEEYEAALAREVDWDLLPDGTLERADGQDGHRVLDDAKLGEDAPDGPSEDPDDALDGLEEMLAG